MRLSEQLKKEFSLSPVGQYVPSYFRSIGYRENLGEPIAKARAAATYTLFAKPEPYIYKNDLIIGCQRSRLRLLQRRIAVTADAVSVRILIIMLPITAGLSIKAFPGSWLTSTRLWKNMRMMRHGWELLKICRPLCVVCRRWLPIMPARHRN